MAFNSTNYSSLRLDQSRPGVLKIALKMATSEINNWTQEGLSELTDVVQRLKTDTETKVVLFTSDVQYYFIAGLDLTIQPFG